MLAYFILVHRYPEQFKRLFKSIYERDNVYVIHIDKRASEELKQNISQFLAPFSNTKIIKSKNALWGGYSLVEAELRGIAELLKMSNKWEYFINLSGQDFPLKSQTQIKNFLTKHAGQDFLKVLDQYLIRPDTAHRFENYCFEWGNRIIHLPFKRKFLSGVTPYIGNQWMTVTRKFCEFLCSSQEVRRYKKFYAHTFIADESFFQTVIMNTSYKAKLTNDDLRAIDWIPEGTIKLRPRTFTINDASFLLNNPALFARKFDETVDTEIINLLENNLRQESAS